MHIYKDIKRYGVMIRKKNTQICQPDAKRKLKIIQIQAIYKYHSSIKIAIKRADFLGNQLLNITQVGRKLNRVKYTLIIVKIC